MLAYVLPYEVGKEDIESRIAINSNVEGLAWRPEKGMKHSMKFVRDGENEYPGCI